MHIVLVVIGVAVIHSVVVVVVVVGAYTYVALDVFYLRADYRIECYDTKYYGFVALGVVMLLVCDGHHHHHIIISSYHHSRIQPHSFLFRFHRSSRLASPQ